ncbi:DUF5683 domain-containing protein [Myroides sp. LJL116]
MKSRFIICLFFCTLLSLNTFGQSKKEKKQELDSQEIDALAPARAAFLTSVVPGLGQIYNKSYWKVPLVYAGIGIPAYFWADNQKQYTSYRNEYKRRLQGIVDKDDPIFGELDNQRLLDAQKFYRRNRDLSVVITVGFYILSIVDANVDAHLSQFNVNENLTIKPVFELNNKFDPVHQMQYAVNISYKF